MAEIRTSSDVSLQPEDSLSIWNNRNFVLLFVTGILFAVGSSVYELALPLILYDLSQSSVVMGTMRAIEFLPNVLLAVFIGVLVDRVNTKRFMQSVMLAQVLFLVVLFLMISAGFEAYAMFYVIGFFLMTCKYGYINVRFSIVKHVIPHDLLTSANAKFSFVSTFVSVMGPAISGLILFLSHPHYGLVITAGALFVAYVLATFLKVEQPKSNRPPSTFWQDLQEGWTALRANRALWMLTMLVTVRNASEGMFNAMVIFYGKDTLQLNDSQLGLVLASAGLGGIVGTMVVTRLRKKFRIGYLYGAMILLLGFSYAIMYFATNAWLMATSMFFVDLFGIIAGVCVWSFRQETTPAHLMGRISGITGAIFKVGMPLTIFGAGWMTDAIGASYVFLGSGILNLLLFFIYLRTPLRTVK